MRDVQIVWAHPRENSLTAAVVSAVSEELKKHHFSVTELDLYRTGFRPILEAADEPDWADCSKVYSDDIMKLANDLKSKDSVIFVFPVWWYSVPAIMKGYIDRVWNHGLAYGPKQLFRLSSVFWIGLMGTTEQNCAALGLNTSMETQLNVGIAEFCGIKDSETLILYETVAEQGTYSREHYLRIISNARERIAEWARALTNNL